MATQVAVTLKNHLIEDIQPRNELQDRQSIYHMSIGYLNDQYLRRRQARARAKAQAAARQAEAAVMASTFGYTRVPPLATLQASEEPYIAQAKQDVSEGAGWVIARLRAAASGIGLAITGAWAYGRSHLHMPHLAKHYDLDDGTRYVWAERVRRIGWVIPALLVAGGIAFLATSLPGSGETSHHQPAAAGSSSPSQAVQARQTGKTSGGTAVDTPQASGGSLAAPSASKSSGTTASSSGSTHSSAPTGSPSASPAPVSGTPATGGMGGGSPQPAPTPTDPLAPVTEPVTGVVDTVLSVPDQLVQSTGLGGVLGGQ